MLALHPHPTPARAPIWLATALTSLLLLGCGGGGSGAGAGDTTPQGLASVTTLSAPDALLSARELLGKRLFTDVNLSEPAGTACVACHQPVQGFAGNHGSALGVALGSRPDSVGLRNAMGNAYGAFVPPFDFRLGNGPLRPSGGHFWDGRADTLALQALGPLLNPLEMNNADASSVVAKVAASSYAASFRAEFGSTIFDDPASAILKIGEAIEAFERSGQLQPFSSKYDAMLRSQTVLNASEARGMALFMDPARANCAGCHRMNPASARPQDSLFSDFSFFALGVPRNPAIPRNADPAFFDLGLCGPSSSAPALPAGTPPGLNIEQFCGAFRMPTLRNVAQRPAFMHNGFFKDLSEVVRFYATRDTDPTHWYGATGVPNDLPAPYLRNVERNRAPFNRASNAGALLSEGEIGDIVAFMRTLSDGFASP